MADGLRPGLVQVAVTGGEARGSVLGLWMLEELLELHRRIQAPVVVAIDPAEAHPESGMHDGMNDSRLALVSGIDVVRFTGREVAGDRTTGGRADIYEGTSGEFFVFEQVGGDAGLAEVKIEFLVIEPELKLTVAGLDWLGLFQGEQPGREVRKLSTGQQDFETRRHGGNRKAFPPINFLSRNVDSHSARQRHGDVSSRFRENNARIGFTAHG